MPSRYVTHFGEEFVPVTMAVSDRFVCRFCGARLMRGERAAQFPHQPTQHKYECSKCIYAGYEGRVPPWKE